ncbi:MAG: hypothetical protein P4M12_00690 [Gammaproteobacteria bacterium]|nr:hypothetical protein [Gammaproteobacteria bacterium]
MAHEDDDDDDDDDDDLPPPEAPEHFRTLPLTDWLTIAAIQNPGDAYARYLTLHARRATYQLSFFNDMAQLARLASYIRPSKHFASNEAAVLALREHFDMLLADHRLNNQNSQTPSLSPSPN